jgi:hypothetical protein
MVNRCISAPSRLPDGRDTGSVLPTDPDPDTIADKPAFERGVADELAARLARSEPDRGDYLIRLSGSYPDTEVQVSGRNVRTGDPDEWRFRVWEFFTLPPNAAAAAEVMHANMAV